LVYHVLNRGNDRKAIFRKQGDARAFVDLLAEAKRRVPTVRLLAWCLMSNHWHLVLWPTADDDVSTFMAWLSNAHVRRYRQHYHTTGDGHLYQGRFKSFPVRQHDVDVLAVIRYVEANPLRAGLVARAEDWPWSSLHEWHRGAVGIADAWPVDRPTDWLAIVNAPQPDADLTAVRTSVTRGRPFGPPAWAESIATELGLTFTLRDRGRPRKGDIQNIPPSDSPVEHT
jgi:putative transposase